MHLDGEQIHMAERVVLSPAAGTFVPLEPAPAVVDADGVIGHIRAAGALVEVRSAFGGALVEVVAAHGQRLRPHERVAWLRVA